MEAPVPLVDAQVLRVATETCAPAAGPPFYPRLPSLFVCFVFRCLFFALFSVKRQFDDSKMYKKHKIREITKTKP